MTTLPEWCSKQYMQRYVGGQVRIINRYIDTCFHGEISGITLSDDGLLTITYAWFAVGVDGNNRCSLKNRIAWVEDDDTIDEFSLWHDMAAIVRDAGVDTPAESHEPRIMMLHIGRPVSDGRLIVDGGELMEAVLTFMPPGVMALPREEVRPADPDNPVDRSNTYLNGSIPGGLRMESGHTFAFYMRDSDGLPWRMTLGDDGR